MVSGGIADCHRLGVGVGATGISEQRPGMLVHVLVHQTVCMTKHWPALTVDKARSRGPDPGPRRGTGVSHRASCCQQGAQTSRATRGSAATRRVKPRGAV